MAGGEADGEEGEDRVDGLREEVGGEREGADGVEHLSCGGLRWWKGVEMCAGASVGCTD